MLTKEKLEAIRQRAEKATEGPWFAEYQDVKTETVRDRKYGEPQMIAEVIYDEANDAEFIAHARNDIPELLAEVERLKKKFEYIVDLSLEMYEENRDVWTLRPELERYRDTIQEILVISNEEAVNNDD